MNDSWTRAFLLGATVLLAVTGLSSSPNFIGILGLLVTLQLYPRLFTKRLNKAVQPWAASAVGAFISHAGAASNALQSSALSMVILAGISAFVSAMSISAIYVDAHYIGKNRRFTWFRLTAFPAIWASLWGIISLFSPVGRLLAWSPVNGLGPYNWLPSYLGPWGVDFVVAGWSVLLTEAITISLSRRTQSIEEPYTDDPEETPSRGHSTYHKSMFAGLLVALTLPSIWVDTIPIPTYTTSTTPITLGCVLPRTHLPHNTPHHLVLDDYINETRTMTSAKLVLWPEGALKFDTEADRDAAFERIANKTLIPHKGLHIGLGFEEYVPGLRNKRAGRRNGFALLVEDKVVMQYYKRNLVPIAESFSMFPSDEEPIIYELPLGPPKGTPKSEWAAAPNYTRPIPITSSICLDFSSQSSFLSLDSRPALILAPARTWHPSVALAMWNQARQRALEAGSTILWCDGGEGGLSGIIGGGFNEPFQSGEGSWVKTIGLTHPFPKHKTVFTSTWVGNIGAFFVIWIATGCGGLMIQAAAASPYVRMPVLAWNIVGRASRGLAGLFRRGGTSDTEQGGGRRLIDEGGRGEGPLLDLDDDEQERQRHQTATYGATQHGLTNS